MSNVHLEVSPRELKLRGTTLPGEKDLVCSFKFKKVIDDDSIKAKFSKKKGCLSITGLLAL